MMGLRHLAEAERSIHQDSNINRPTDGTNLFVLTYDPYNAVSRPTNLRRAR
jgi:hypothetical protein